MQVSHEILHPARYELKLAVSLASIIFVLPYSAWAQSTPKTDTGSIEGSVFVVDQSDNQAFVLEATVTLNGPDFRKETESDSTGKYSFTEIPAGK